jgi:hypothetical protein
MNLFDLVGIASKIPADLTGKLEADLPKLKQLQAIYMQAAPHLIALEPLVKEAETVWNTISPDVMALIDAIGAKP